MRTMKVMVATMLVSGLMVGSANAQDPQQIAKVPPQARADLQTDFMAKKLNLTPEERTQVAAINLNYANQMQPVLAGDSGMFTVMREMKRLDASKDTDLQKVLTPEQYQSYLASKSELRDRLKQKALETAQASN